MFHHITAALGRCRWNLLIAACLNAMKKATACVRGPLQLARASPLRRWLSLEATGDESNSKSVRHAARSSLRQGPSPFPTARRCHSAGADRSAPPPDATPDATPPLRVVTTVDSDGAARVRLNRPDKLNAVDLPMFVAIRDALKDLRSRTGSGGDVRAVVLSGTGRAFCSGLDVKSVLGGGNPLRTARLLLHRPDVAAAADDDAPEGGDKAAKDGFDDPVPPLPPAVPNLAQVVACGWRELQVPVACVVHGVCYGAGLQIALGADVRFASKDSKWSVMEGKWGLIPDMGASIALRELVRIDVAKDLTFTGRIVSGEEAHKIGLVTHLSDTPEEATRQADEWVAQVVNRSPDALRLAKRLYQETWNEPSHNACLRLESDFQRSLLGRWNQLAASGRSALGWKIPYW